MYAAPFSAPYVLALDTTTDAVYGVSTEDVSSGPQKWLGVTAVGAKVYAAPYNALHVLAATVPVPSACDSTDASALNSEACICGEDVCAASQFCDADQAVGSECVRASKPRNPRHLDKIEGRRSYRYSVKYTFRHYIEYVRHS